MNQLHRVRPSDAVTEWHRLGRLLAPAINRTGKTQIEVLQHIVSKEMQCWQTFGGVIVTSVGPAVDTTSRCLWVVYAAGKAGGWKRMRAILDELEDMAREAGCMEVRFEGRTGWQRLFRDYRATDGEMRKALA